jgi:hypothetical protein
MWELAKKRYVFFVLRFIQAIYLEAVKKDPEIIIDWMSISDSNRKRYFTYRTYLEAVKKKGNMIIHIPEDENRRNPVYYTKEMIFAAIRSDGWVLRYFNRITTEMYMEAVKSNGLVLKLIDKSIDQYNTICLEAVKQNGLALEYVDESFITYDICLEAVKQNGLALEFAIKRLRVIFIKLRLDTVLELCCSALLQNHEAIVYVPKKLQNVLRNPRLWLTETLENQDYLRIVCPEFVIIIARFNEAITFSRRAALLQGRETGLKELRKTSF